MIAGNGRRSKHHAIAGFRGSGRSKRLMIAGVRNSRSSNRTLLAGLRRGHRVKNHDVVSKTVRKNRRRVALAVPQVIINTSSFS